MNLIDLLQEQARYNARRSLIEIMPVRTAVSMSQLLIFEYITTLEFANLPDL